MKGSVLGDAKFPASANCFGFFLCGYLLQVALCQTHSVTRTHAHSAPHWTHTLMAFWLVVGRGKRVSLGVKFALTGVLGRQENQEGRAQDPWKCLQALRRPAKVLNRFSLEIKDFLDALRILPVPSWSQSPPRGIFLILV